MCSCCKLIVLPSYTSKLEKMSKGFNDVASLTESLFADLSESWKAKLEEDHSQGYYAAFMSESS